MKKTFVRILIFVGVAAILLILLFKVFLKPSVKNNYILTEVETSNIKSFVACTGTINAKGTVEVSSQITGQVDKVYVDYNSVVKKDQLLASLDTRNLKLSLKSTEADYKKAKAEYEYALKEYENNKKLFESNLISSFEFEKYYVNKQTTSSALEQSSVVFKKAKTNLDYAYITSPIYGTVIDKNIKEGQIVNASMSSPTLFIIAENLDKIEIEALVDETDVGRVKKRQKVTFTVSSYPYETFTGEVDKIILNPKIESNVSNYKVIITSDNNKRLLFPGMTATIEILIEEKQDVLCIDNSALRFTPSSALLNGFAKRKNIDLNLLNKTNNRTALLWFINENNDLDYLEVNLGINDGQKTELLNNPDINLGMKFISNIQKIKVNENDNGFEPPQDVPPA